MKQITGYVADYFRHINRVHFLVTSLGLSILIGVNYYYLLNNSLLSYSSFLLKFSGYYLLFASTFIATWVSGFGISGKKFPRLFYFYLLLASAPAIFAIKVSLQVADLIYLDNNYLNAVLQWPLKAIVTCLLIYILWSVRNQPAPFAGLSASNFNARPYFILLLGMFPLLLAAGHGVDFQRIYPKLQIIKGSLTWLQQLFFELSYGLDFFTIELFFRGFLVLIFIRYGGEDAILPMAVFYCTIHFGKPIAECISSYFGGLILGAVVYNTRSIWGGLIIHLGIAWIMEAVGFLM